jgi:hypothetical protein
MTHLGTYRTSWHDPFEDGFPNQRFEIRVYLVSQNIANNTSDVRVELYAEQWRWIYPGSGARHIMTGTIDGTNYNRDAAIGTNGSVASQLVYVGAGTKTITHNSNGTKTITVSGAGRTTVNFTRTLYTGAKSITLPTIARTSSVTNNTASNNRIDFGSNVTFTISRASSDFTHTLSYVSGGTTHTIGSGIGTSRAYSFPTSLINNYTNTTNPNITVKCETYSGSTKIGEVNTTVYLHVPSSYVPSCSLAIEDTNPITNGWGIWVKSRSILKGTVTASGVAGSSISSRISNFEGQTFNGSPFSKTISGSGNLTVTSEATDSRGRKKSDSKQIAVLDYNNPTLVSVTIQRCNSNGTANEYGTYGKFIVEYNVTSLSNKNKKVLRVKLGSTTRTITLPNYSGTITATTAQLFSGLNINTTYNFTFEIEDSFETITQSHPLPPSYVLMSKRAGGKGITFGQIAEKDGFNVHMPAEFNEGMNIKGDGLYFNDVLLFGWSEE